ncbi:MAG: S8 family serine peptidase, partial [Actinomycetota bacterium]|nr:S8 family serine peptidase [Actinomycetota bacterium]
MSLRPSRSLTSAAVLACVAALTVGVAGPATIASASRPSSNSDSRAAQPALDKQTALVQLSKQPVLIRARAASKTDGRVNLTSAAANQQRKALSDERAEFRSWLGKNAPDARIIGHHDLAVNAVTVRLRGTSLASLRNAPQARTVQYQRLYQPLGHEDPDLDLIDAPEAWTLAAGGDRDAGALPSGERVKVGVVDTGIDIKHPCFSGAGFPQTKQLGDNRFTNNKVIVARVFNNKIHQQGFTAEAIGDHGTHVSGTVACNLHTPAEVDGVDIPFDPSGVAPAAQLGNYNVFPGEVGNARSEDILDALEAAYADGMDVVNMSLGGAASGKQDLLTHAVDNLDRAGMVVAISAGNSGPGHFTVGSPGSAERALTSGASTVGHFVGAPVTVAGRSYGAASGDFATVDENLTAPLAVVSGTTNGLSTACSALPAGSLSGKIALISRGSCSFSTKIRNAQNAGAVAVLVQNNAAGDPTAMGSDGTANQPTVPAYMVGLKEGKAMQAFNGQATTISATLRYFLTGNDDIMAGFSSQGPTDVDFRVKPDVVSPGVNVLSSIPLPFCGDETTCWAFFQGTSMSSPHTAGSAAVVMDAFITRDFDTFTAEQVRSAITNTAEQGVLTSYLDGTTVVNDVNIVGAGQVDLDSAVQATVGVGPVSTSFGAVPNGSGQTLTKSVSLSSLTGTQQVLTVSLDDPADAADFRTSSKTVTVPAYMVGLREGRAMQAQNGKATTISAAL